MLCLQHISPCQPPPKLNHSGWTLILSLCSSRVTPSVPWVDIISHAARVPHFGKNQLIIWVSFQKSSRSFSTSWVCPWCHSSVYASASPSSQEGFLPNTPSNLASASWRPPPLSCHPRPLSQVPPCSPSPSGPCGREGKRHPNGHNFPPSTSSAC